MLVDPTLYPSFWVKVQKTDSCWLWTAYCNKGGYGSFTFRQKKYLATRFAYMICKGGLKSADKILHSCDNPPCVNPDHLFIGTPKRNSEEMVERGRSTRGEKHGRAAITTALAVWARKVYIPRDPRYGVRALARRLGVSPITLSRAIRGETKY